MPHMHHQKRFNFGLTTLAGLSLLATSAFAQQQPQPLVVKHLKDNVYWGAGGAGGNSGIIIGDKGVIVIDCKTTTDSAKELLAEIAKITPKPVTTVIETHSDGDHVNGIAAFPQGITVIAQENNRKEQEAAIARGGRGAPPSAYLPNQVITKNKESLKLEGVSFTLLHWAPAHTSGDLVVYLPKQKIVFTGDIIATQRPDPLIHLEKHGTAEGWIETTKGIAALNADTFVPGHGVVQTKAEIQKRLKDTEEKYAKIKEMVGQGKSLSEIRQALGEPEPVAAAPGRGPGFPSFTETTYKELTSKSS
jgi:glyoxylase-like metal-dependent hydrolase (beta-lactamase superfamily II)